MEATKYALKRNIFMNLNLALKEEGDVELGEFGIQDILDFDEI